ncbi:forkhead box protein N4-like isoform X2 [Littorina saxatilis]|uniref:forkhead box protein N4-like isoform X2 n=1 Tax=Littorina saxatilis TaxID=31220 RepID=UPI0038B5E581
MADDFGRRSKADPLLFDCDDKDTLDSLLGTGDRNSSFGDIDLDTLDPNNDFMSHWLQNSSMSQLATVLDTDHEASLSDGNLLSVNPETIMPMQQSQPSHVDSETINSAAMRLHANCSDVDEVKTVLVQQQQQQQQQQTQHIQLVAVPVTLGSGSTPHNSPLKGGTAIILDGTTFSQISVAGTTYLASPQKFHTVSSSNQKSRSVLTPSQCSPVLVGHLQGAIAPSVRQPITVTVASPLKHTNFVQQHSEPQRTMTNVHHHHHHEDKVYPKPVFSYSCLIALALKNSKAGNLPVSEIYNFMCENFPYFKTAPDGWKNSVRHNLSLNKCFAKVDNPKLSSGAKKGCLWALNPAKVKKMEEEITKWGKKDPALLLNSMAYPENLEAIEKGQAGLPFRKGSDSEDENVPSPPQPPPVAVTIKKEIQSTPQKQVEDFLNQYAASPMHQHDMDQEYLSHALEWGMQNIDNLSVDLLANSPLTSSPIATHGSPLPHTPSRSGSLTSV